MSEIFQHLRISDPATAGSDYQRDAKFMEEMAETESQGILTTLVDANTNRKYLVAKSIPYWMIDTINVSSSYPVGTGGDMERSGATYQKSVAAYQAAVSGREIQAIRTGSNELVMAEGVVAGYESILPFQVSHAGGTQWIVKGGRFLNHMVIADSSQVQIQELEIPDVRLKADKGFVGFYLGVESQIISGSTLLRTDIVSTSPLQVVPSYVQKMPLKSITGGLFSSISYSPGLVFCPIAYVTSAEFGGPFIHPIHSGFDLRFGQGAGWRDDTFPGYTSA